MIFYITSEYCAGLQLVHVIFDMSFVAAYITFVLNRTRLFGAVELPSFIVNRSSRRFSLKSLFKICSEYPAKIEMNRH